MSTDPRLEQRLAAVERAVVDGDTALGDLEAVATLADDVARLEAKFETHERRLAELEGRLDALSGFAGSVESVNETVEHQADAAIAAVDRLEYRIDELERRLDSPAELDGEFAATVAQSRPDREAGVGAETEPAFGFGADSSDRHSNGANSAAAEPAESTAETPERAASDILAGTKEADADGDEASGNIAGNDADEPSSGLLASVRSRLS